MRRPKDLRPDRRTADRRTAGPVRLAPDVPLATELLTDYPRVVLVVTEEWCATDLRER
jgi:hypothetical protein